MKRALSVTDSQIHRFRLRLMLAFVIVLSLLLVLRLAYLQFSQFKRYATLSLKNQMSIIPIAPPRGIILDRNGVVLADNIPVYGLEIVPERVKHLDQTLRALQHLLPSITNDDIDNFKRARLQSRSYIPIPLKLKLSQDEVAIFATNQYRFSGVRIKAQLMRFYPLGETMSHVLGYVGRLNEQELRQMNHINYQATNFIGKAGIEKYYEALLHGQVGYEQVETDVSGRVLRTLSKQRPVSGSKLYLTLDTRIQQAAYQALKGKRGAIVAIRVRDGEVLAMASSPSYDPNLFVNGISHQDYEQLVNSPDRPLYNRAVRGLYPPASTVKPYISLAGLERGMIDSNTKIYDPGWYKLPNVSHAYRDWKHTGHGITNLKRAITVSCDTYFYQLGNRMGITAIEDILMQFGFGQLTHIDLQEEAPGLVPSPLWKKRSKGTHWYPGDTLITAIGQGFMLASPLQLANAVAALSQHGRRFRPHLFKQSIQDNGERRVHAPLEEYPVRLKNTMHWNIVTDAMQAVVNTAEGTATARFGHHHDYTVAGKTGTAQVFSGSQYEKTQYENIPERLRDHTLFIAFAPVDKPEIAIGVVIEHDHSAPQVAREVLDSYFKFTEPNEPHHEG